MKAADVQIGQTYAMNHSSGRIKARILAIKPPVPGIRTRAHWLALNLKTSRDITIKSAARLTPIKPTDGYMTEADKAAVAAKLTQAIGYPPVGRIEAELGLPDPEDMETCGF